MVNNALADYGAELTDDNFITKNGKATKILVVVKKGRLRFGSESGSHMSGSVTGATVCAFVEKFWYWNKVTK